MTRALGLTILLLLAVAAGFASRGTQTDSSLPTLDNKGPRGLAVLGAWLEQHTRVERSAAPLTQLPPDLASLVLTAPSAAELGQAEVDAVKAFAERGGTVVYLAAREGPPQVALHRWLGLHWVDGPWPNDEPSLKDVGGVTVLVTIPAGLLEGTSTLRLAAEKAVRLDLDEAVPVTTPEAAWWVKVGGGEVWVLAGADLAQSARLEALDNSLFWAHLASRGPVLFDEFHHARTAAPPTPVNVNATLAQLAVLGLAFVLVFGRRLGPAREDAPRTHRSGLEYVQALARVTAEARVEPELVEVVRAHARALAHQQLGVATTLPWDEASRLIAARLSQAPQRADGVRFDASAAFAALGQPLRFHEASVLAARFEQAVRGAS
jgi:hypothetical protein